tara:strand:- start:214 stop:453 length:240 start_codon:yes stop_codon:yes gene_type:complete
MKTLLDKQITINFLRSGLRAIRYKILHEGVKFVDAEELLYMANDYLNNPPNALDYDETFDGYEISGVESKDMYFIGKTK